MLAIWWQWVRVIDLVHKAVEVVDPVVQVVVRLGVIAWLQRLARETIRAIQCARNMSKDKMEGEDSNDPAINACTRLKTWIC